MKLYKNANLTEEIDLILDLGIVQAGDTKEYEFYVYNETNAELINLSFSLNHNEIEVLSFPQKLQSKEGGFLKIKYSPSISIKKGLKTSLDFKGTEIYS